MKKIGLLLLFATIIGAVIIGMYKTALGNDQMDQQPPEQKVIENENNDELEERGLLYGYTIFLDPGHGGKDGGAVGANGTVEKDITYMTAERIMKKLQEYDANVQLTRYDDRYVELADRVQMAKTGRAHLFVSIHYDGFESAEVNGITTYYYHQRDERFARMLHKKIMNEKIDARDRGLAQGDYFVLRENEITAVLLELGYITNPVDEERMNTDEFQDHVAEAVVDGVIEYLEQTAYE